MIIYSSRSQLSSAPQQRTEENFYCLLPIPVSIHPDFPCKKFIRAMYKAIKYIEETDDAVLAKSLLKQFPDTSLESITASIASYRKIDAWMKHMAMTETAFNNLQDVMSNAGELSRRVSYTEITDNTYANSLYGEVFK